MAQIPCWSIHFVFNLPVSSFTLSREYSFNHTIMHSLVKRNFRLSLREVYLLRKAVYFQYSIVSPWSSLIVGDERLDRPKQKAVVIMQRMHGIRIPKLLDCWADSVAHLQCDQIGRNFSTLAIFKKPWLIF